MDANTAPATAAQIDTLIAYNTAIFNLTGHGRIVPRDETPAFTMAQADAMADVLARSLTDIKTALVKNNPIPGTEEE